MCVCVCIMRRKTVKILLNTCVYHMPDLLDNHVIHLRHSVICFCHPVTTARRRPRNAGGGQVHPTTSHPAPTCARPRAQKRTRKQNKTTVFRLLSFSQAFRRVFSGVS